MTDSENEEFLRSIRVPTPCPVSWEEMQGDDRIRFCGQCNLNVHNLSSLTTDEAAELLKEKMGKERICVQYCQNDEGKIKTINSKRSWRHIAATIISALSLIPSVFAQSPQKSNTKESPKFLVEPKVRQEFGPPHPSKSDSHMARELRIAGVPDVDFGPYMKDLQTKIKNNWKPKGKDIQKVVVAFKVFANGSISNLKLVTSSGTEKIDQHCLEAVSKSKLLPLPCGAPSDVDIQFTFDHNLKNGYKESPKQRRF